MTPTQATLHPCDHQILYSDLNGVEACPTCHRHIEQIEIQQLPVVGMERDSLVKHV